MELQKLVCNLMVEDVNKTVAYYEEVLDYIHVMNLPEFGQWDWALVKRDGIELMFQSKRSMQKEFSVFKNKEISSTTSLYITVDHVKEYYRMLEGKVTMVKELHPTQYGTEEFAFQDCNGYILVYAQRLR